MWRCTRRCQALVGRLGGWQSYGVQGRQASSAVSPDEADTVVIGGGVVGCSIAYHLAKAGQKRVVLLERSELTAGSTWHAAGLTTYYHPGINLKKIHYYSMELFKQLEAETGQAVGLHTCGSLRLAATPERCDEFRYQMTRNNWHPNEQRIIGPDEIREIHPILNMDTILMGLLNPGDGHIDPYSVTQAFAAGARLHGAQIVQGVEVTGTTARADGRWTVESSQGTITADRVVNAAGFFGRHVGQLAGLDLPLAPIEHTYLVTSSIPEVAALKREPPVIRDLVGSYYLRQERDGLLFGLYEDADRMKVVDDWYDAAPPQGFGMELFESDLERLTPNIEKAMELVPCLAGGEITRSVCGPITYSPDVLGLVGPYQGLRNYWTAVGFGYGIIHSGGVGKYMADWIMNGEPPYDLIELDPNRYGQRWADRTFVLAKARESYGLNTAYGWPKEERAAGRPTPRATPLSGRLSGKGAEMGFHSGWEQPTWFADPSDPSDHYQPSFHRTNWFEPVQREVETVLTKAGLIDLSPFGKLTVEGPDAERFVDYVFANRVPKEGRTLISHMLTPSGRVYSEMTVTRLATDAFFCVTGSGSELHDLRWLEEQVEKTGLQVTVTNVTDAWGALGLAGPLSRELLSQLTEADLSPAAFPFLAMRDITVAGVPVMANRISYTGELGWELYAPPEHMVALYSALSDAGAPLGCGDFGTYAMNTLRLEKGFRGWGAEMNLDTSPVEAGLMPFVRLNKAGDFVGKSAVARIVEQGVGRQLVMLALDGDQDVDPEGNETVWSGDQVVGNTTSGCFSVSLQQRLAFAYVNTDALASDLEVDLLCERSPARVLDRPPAEVEVRRSRAKQTAV